MTAGGYVVRETDTAIGAPDDPAGFWAEHVRTPADVRSDDEDRLLLVVARLGAIVVEQDGLELRLRPGRPRSPARRGR